MSVNSGLSEVRQLGQTFRGLVIRPGATGVSR